MSHTLPGLCYHGEPPKKHYHTQTRRIRKMPIEAVVTSLRLKVCNRARYYKLPIPSRKAPQFANFSPFLSHRLSSPFEPSRGKFPISGKSSSPSRTQLPVQDIQTLHGNSIITSFTTTARQLHFPPPPSPLNSLPGSWLSTPTHQKTPQTPTLPNWITEQNPKIMALSEKNNFRTRTDDVHDNTEEAGLELWDSFSWTCCESTCDLFLRALSLSHTQTTFHSHNILTEVSLPLVFGGVEHFSRWEFH